MFNENNYESAETIITMIEEVFPYDVISARKPVTDKDLQKIRECEPQEMNLPDIMEDWVDDNN